MADADSGLRDLLALPDKRLVRALDDRDKYEPPGSAVLKAFRANRQELSGLAWDAFSTALDCDSGPIAKTGVFGKPMDDMPKQEILYDLLLAVDKWAFGRILSVPISRVVQITDG